VPLIPAQNKSTSSELRNDPTDNDPTVYYFLLIFFVSFLRSVFFSLNSREISFCLLEILFFVTEESCLYEIVKKDSLYHTQR